VVSVLVILNVALNFFVWILIISAVLSWLIAFNVVNMRNPVVAQITDILWRMTEPLLRPIRNVMPNLGGLDISPIVLILLIWLIIDLNSRYLIPMVQRAGL